MSEPEAGVGFILTDGMTADRFEVMIEEIKKKIQEKGDRYKGVIALPVDPDFIVHPGFQTLIKKIRSALKNERTRTNL